MHHMRGTATCTKFAAKLPCPQKNIPIRSTPVSDKHLLTQPDIPEALKLLKHLLGEQVFFLALLRPAAM